MRPKRSRYSDGEMLFTRWNVRRIRSSPPNPTRPATCLIDKFPAQNASQAASTLACCTKLAGLEPISNSKRRMNVRTLRPDIAASRATLKSSEGRDLIWATTWAREPEASICARKGALNCSCPPGRLRYNTRLRASCSASSRPRSASTIARAMSMPEDTPADVQAGPSVTKIASDRTSMEGYRFASSPQYAQCVVAARPSRYPLAASTNAPVQTDPTRRARCIASAKAGRLTIDATASKAPCPPATSSVSITSSSISLRAVVGNARPVSVMTWPPAAE